MLSVKCLNKYLLIRIEMKTKSGFLKERKLLLPLTNICYRHDYRCEWLARDREVRWLAQFFYRHHGLYPDPPWSRPQTRVLTMLRYDESCLSRTLLIRQLRRHLERDASQVTRYRWQLTNNISLARHHYTDVECSLITRGTLLSREDIPALW